MLGGNANNEPVVQVTTWKDLAGMLLSKEKPVSRGYILNESIQVTFWGKLGEAERWVHKTLCTIFELFVYL